MSCVLVDNKEIERIKRSEYISSGEEGSCYLYNNLIFKIYHEQKYNREVFFDIEKSNYIAFPEDILIDINKKTIVGYNMRILKGSNLKNGFLDNLKLLELENAYLRIIKEIEKFSYIDMNNISLTNVLFDYNNNNIYLIDTSLWNFLTNLKNLNRERLNYTLINALTITLDWNRYRLNSEKNLFDLYGMHLHGESYFLDFLKELESIVSEQKNEKVKTIKDLKI